MTPSRRNPLTSLAVTLLAVAPPLAHARDGLLLDARPLDAGMEAAVLLLGAAPADR